MIHNERYLRLGAREIAVYAMLGALAFALKVTLAGLPNIEPVSLLVIVYTVVLGKKALWPIYTYVALEFIMWGPGVWNISYLYIWAILYLLSRLLREIQSSLGWAVLSGAFGMFFGLLCTPVYLIAGGWAYAVSWWLSGIPYDLLHCGGNFILTMLLFRPLCNVLKRLKRQTLG